MGRSSNRQKWGLTRDSETAAIAEGLASVGFSYRLIAELALGINRDDNGFRARSARKALASHVNRVGIRLKDWRDGRTPLAQRFALGQVTTAKRPRRKRGKAA